MKVIAHLATLGALFAAANGKRFFLATDSDNDAFKAKCVYSYHTGAGLGDATLGDCGPAPPKQFSYDGSRIAYHGYGKSIQAGVDFDDGRASYDDWGAVTINVGRGSKGFKYSKSKGFTAPTGYGFIACHWAHGGAKQVFALASSDINLPSSCARIKLLQGCYNTDPGCNE